jgi:hypothetical protein
MLKLGQKRPNYRSSVGYTVPKTRIHQQPSQVGGFLPLLLLGPALAGLSASAVATSAINKQTGSGVVDDADMLYQQAKSGQGLRLAGQGVGVAGGALSLAGESEGGALDLPGSGLRNNLLHALPKIKKKRVSSSADRSLLGTPYNVGTERTMGNGVGLAGRGKALDAVNDTIYKAVQLALDKLGVNHIIPDSLVRGVIESSTKKASNTVKDVIVNVSKKIIPILTKTGLFQTGNGMHYGKVIQSKKYDKLHGKFAKYLASRVAGQDGGSFWDDFVSGFMSVIKPAASILGPIASAVFPEFSPAIGAVTSLIDKA